MIKSTEEADNIPCLPIGSANISKMGIRYNKPAKATRSGSQAGSASHTTAPSASGAGDQEVDSHPGPSRAPRVSAAQKGLVNELREELLFKLPDPLMAPLRAEFGERLQRLEDRIDEVETKLDFILAILVPGTSNPTSSNSPPNDPPPPPPQNDQPPPPPPNDQPQPPPQNDHQPQPSPRNDHHPSPHNSPQNSPQHSPRHSPLNPNNSPSPHNSPNHSPPPNPRRPSNPPLTLAPP